ncbi:hypothetical protein DPMN_082533 [Dreissena polymorpha]|uniref:Uncharacterized protein n=1 Tax=Dreissena polymorpha TaxID=45954 RepID=A0A9D4BGW4_DREPO|nr:hypothetical protein DPMN_082500 [Dreissena polymorpha]KAH3695080.1 hypothetical protein DPMN_082533 [Dreissena polymorpha]
MPPTKIAVKSTTGWQVIFGVEADVPLSNSVSSVPSLSEFISNCWAVQGKAIALGRPYYSMLKSRMNLRI